MRNFNLLLLILILFISFGCKLSQQKVSDRLQGVWLLENSIAALEMGSNINYNKSEKLFPFHKIEFEGSKYQFYTNYKNEEKIEKGDFEIIESQLIILKNRIVSPALPDHIDLKDDSLTIKRVSEKKLKLKITMAIKYNASNIIKNTPFAAPNVADLPKSGTLTAIFKKED